MPSWNDGDEDSEEETLMELEVYETPDTIPEPLYSGPMLEDGEKCMMHRLRPKKCVAFEGTHTGRRFNGCCIQGGVNCGVVQWIDKPWPIILQKCLTRLWEMYHEQTIGRVKDRQAYDRELAKLQKELDDVCNEYQKMADDVSTMFDWQDGIQQDKQQKDVEMLEKKEELQLELKMEKLRLEKDQRCIFQAQADIIKNTRNSMKEVASDRDLLAEEKKELERTVNDLLNAGYGSMAKLEKIKAILEE